LIDWTTEVFGKTTTIEY